MEEYEEYQQLIDFNPIGVVHQFKDEEVMSNEFWTIDDARQNCSVCKFLGSVDQALIREQEQQLKKLQTSDETFAKYVKQTIGRLRAYLRKLELYQAFGKFPSP